MRSFLIKTLPLVFLFATTKVAAQTKEGQSDPAMTKFSGCYQTGIESDGLLRLNPDRTFSWAKSTMQSGTWRMKDVFAIPFRATIIILKYENGKKEKYQVDDGANTGGRKSIAMRGAWLMKETPCL